MRQFAVNNLAIPPEMNARFNRCPHCTRELNRTGNPESLCADHAAELRQYANDKGAPSKLQRGGTRIHYTAKVTEDAPEYDLSRLHDKQQQRIHGG